MKPRLPKLLVTVQPKAPTPLQRATTLMEEDQYVEAISVLQPYLAESPEDGEAWYQLAVSQDVLEDQEAAWASLQRAMRLSTYPDEVLWEWLEYLLDTYDAHLAEGYARRAVEAAPDDPWFRLALAETLLSLGKNDEGEDLALGALAYAPPPVRIPAWAERLDTVAGLLRLVTERPEPAMELLARADALDPVRDDEEPAFEDEDGLLTIQQHEPEADVTSLTYEERFRRAREERDAQIGGMVASGELSLEGARVMRAAGDRLAGFGEWGLMPGVEGDENTWQESVAAKKGRAQGAQRAGYAAFLLNQRRWDEARDQAQRALIADPSLTRAYEVLAHLAALDGDAKEAERCLKEALRRDPRNDNARYALAAVYFAVNDDRHMNETLAPLEERAHRADTSTDA